MRVIESNQLGSVVGRVECELSVLKFHTDPGPAVDGDAAYIKVGTDVHSVRGYQTSCRVGPMAPIGISRISAISVYGRSSRSSRSNV